MLLLAGFVALNLFQDESRSVDLSSIWSTGLYLLLRNEKIKSKSVTISAQRVGFFNIGSGRVGYWPKYRVAGRVPVG